LIDFFLSEYYDFINYFYGFTVQFICIPLEL
jgi:hypothetical protein